VLRPNQQLRFSVYPSVRQVQCAIGLEAPQDLTLLGSPLIIELEPAGRDVRAPQAGASLLSRRCGHTFLTAGFNLWCLGR
jgi:hypothetical protein